MAPLIKTDMSLRVLFVGQTFKESRTAQRAAAMKSLGHDVEVVPTTLSDINYESKPTLSHRVRYKLRYPGDPANANEAIQKAVDNGIDLIWLDAADMVDLSKLFRLNTTTKNFSIVWYSEDDMMNRLLRTRQIEKGIPFIDLWVTTKSFNALPKEVPSLGVQNVFVINNSCDPKIHRPIQINEDERNKFGAPISFIGSFEKPRAQSLLQLAKQGLKLKVWGNGWGHLAGNHPNLDIKNRPVYNDEFAKVVSSSKINLCFLRKSNRDLQTCRSIELPACGGFMVHERNNEITKLYREQKEAIYFSTNTELTEICKSWLKKDKQRSKIGAAARQRTLELELTHESNIIRVLNALWDTSSSRKQ